MGEPMRAGIFVRTLGLWLALLVPLAVVSQEQQLQPPQLVIQDISDQLAAILKRDREKLQSDPAYVYRLANEVLVPHVDFARVSSLVLGKYWRRAKPAQREAFTREFRRLLVRTYSTAFREFDNWQIRHMPLTLKPGEDDVSVRTQVLRGDGRPVDVVYRMHRKDGDWMAYDVKIEGISLVTNYRSSFNKEVRRGGLDRLIRRISELNESRLQTGKIAGG